MRGLQFAVALAALFPTAFAMAAEVRVIEDILVTAQRVEEAASKVPIAVTAFDEAMIEDRQIIGLADLQMNVPNVTFAPRQASFSGTFQIRGIGLQPASGSSESPSAMHVNEIPFPRLYAGGDFYDLERIELMRGPQGTLFGRNATAGALNLVTRQPTFDRVSGYADFELGDYDHRRLKGALNVPVTESLAFRVAGMVLERDGYIDNKAGGQIPGVDDDLDGRDHYAVRITGAWEINDRASLWVMYDRLDENSNRAWEAPTLCTKSTLPVLAGCEPNQVGRDRAHPSASGVGIGLGLEGIIPLGARDAATGLQFEYPRPPLGDRDVHWDGNPEWDLDEEIWAFGFDWSFDQWRLEVTGGYQDTDWRSTQPNTSRGFPVGFELGPTAENPSGLWPMSAFPGPPGFLRAGGECDVDAYTAGVLGGCIADVAQTRGVAFSLLQEDLEYWSLETKLRSTFDGPLNFLLGANYANEEQLGEIMFMGNLMDMLSTQSIGGLPPVYPGFGGWEISGNETESYAIFAELYWQLTDTVKVTLGVRYNEDEIRPNTAVFGLQSLDANFLLGGILGPDPRWVRAPLLEYLSPVGASPDAAALAEYYGAAGAIAAASDLPALIDALQIVPPNERPGEARALAGGSSTVEFEEWSGRFAIDWSVDANTLVYAKYDRGYKPGGAGFAAEDLDNEIIDSFEIGAKTRLFGDTLSLNAAAFIYRYHDMVLGPGTGTQTQGANVDVDGRGIELEVVWYPPQIPNLSANLAYGWADVEVQDYAEIDERDLTRGNPDYVALNSFDSFGANYIAPIAEVLPLIDQAIADGGAIGAASAPGTVYPNGIPAYFSRAYLEANGVGTLDGFVADMDGNQPRHAPEHGVSVGLAYSWFLTPGSLTARWDYYWQDDSYGAVFNSPYDKIDSWGQHNGSITFESAGNQWVTRLWIRNATDEGNVIARSNRQQVIYGEPRVYGVSVRYNLGDDEG